MADPYPTSVETIPLTPGTFWLTAEQQDMIVEALAYFVAEMSASGANGVGRALLARRADEITAEFRKHANA